jgi:LuxR family transcriptional regulator, maltose regulon positive regulatory protein
VPPPAQTLPLKAKCAYQLRKSGLSNREIGAELYVSVNTLKTHAQALYRKLGATDRRDAVRRARALGLS